MQDSIRQGKILSFFLVNRKDSCARRKGGGEKEGWGGGRGGGCLTFIRAIINSLGALVPYTQDCVQGRDVPDIVNQSKDAFNQSTKSEKKVGYRAFQLFQLFPTSN